MIQNFGSISPTPHHLTTPRHFPTLSSPCFHEMDANGDGEMNIFEWEAMYISKMGLKDTVKQVATTKGSFAAPTGGPKKSKDKELTQEEKKARGLLYDVSKAKAVRDDDSDDDEGSQV